MTHLEHALKDGFVKMVGEGKQQKIKYLAVNHTERYADPEEQIRAEFWAELIYRLDYRPERIGVEVTVPRRTPADRADLVIYKDDERKEPYAVIECKKDGITDSEFSQAIEQACGNRASLGASFAGIVAGGTRHFLDFTRAKSQERQKNIIADLPTRYGAPPEFRFYKGDKNRDLVAVPREELRAVIRKCHQTLWEGGKRSPITAFGEFSKIIFVKIRDEVDRKRAKGEPYAFQRRTSETADELAARIHQLYLAEQAREPGVFKNKIEVDDRVLAQVVEHLQSISFNHTDLDTKGVAFEEFMGGFFKGDFGQFFTPRELIAFCVQMLQPTVDDLIIDPACGSGGFLLHALDYVRSEATRRYPDHETDPDQREAWKDYWHSFAKNNLFGIEINEEIARVAKMSMIIHDDGHTNIVDYDALNFMDALRKEKRELKPGAFDLVLTNPPFGAVVKDTEKGGKYLDQFELRYWIGKATTNTDADETALDDQDAKRGAKAIKARASVKTEILFLERVWNFLKPGTGRAAIVVPDGILTNSSLQGVRNWVMEHFQILAVVSLPQFAFQHYDAGVKASIIFLRRRADGETPRDNEAIFMAQAENIGYDATGRKTFAVEVESETEKKERVEIQHSDLFDYRVYFDWATTNVKKPGWQERHRDVIPNTGIVAQFHAFQKNPKPFFAQAPLT
jgi:type I restriction enzyme M protein